MAYTVQGFKLAYEAKRCKILFIKIVYVNSTFGIFVGMLSFGYARFKDKVWLQITTHYVTAYKIIHMYYLKKSCD